MRRHGALLREMGLAALLALVGCADDSTTLAWSGFQGGEPVTNPCGANAVYDAPTNECRCPSGYEYCSPDPRDLSCCLAAGGTPGDGSCGQSEAAGRCDGSVLTFCDDGTRHTLDCALGGLTCGWADELGWYDCLGADGASAPPTNADQCADFPGDGWCADDATLAYCSQPTGSATATIVRVPCTDGRECVEGATGARCEVASGAQCAAGESACAGDTARYCVGGSWVEDACSAGCVQTAIGAGCVPEIALTTYVGTVTYDARGPNTRWDDWGVAEPLPGEGLLVLSLYGDEIVDAQYAGFGDEAGQFSITVPALPGPDDRLVFATLAVDDRGAVTVAVADPDLAAGTQSPGAVGAEPKPWSWAWRLQDNPSGSTFHITEALGSGAVRMYRGLLAGVFIAADRLSDDDPPSLIGWLGPSVSWSCGACFGGLPTEALGGFDSQLWIGGGTDEAYWSDAVVAHESGHYVMFAHGESLREGGPHFAGVPTHPGQAWSEGWATYYSSAIRGSSTYYDKQQGVFFWIDLDLREYGQGLPWNLPEADAGLLQLVDENEVASMLWRIDGDEGGNVGAMLAALASPQMTTSPFGRGYTKRTWDPPSPGAAPLPYESTRISVPFLADFLDVLLCEGLAVRATIDAVTQPTVHYPYPSDDPICP
ncbi:MAG: hypothetical protein H6697_10065 [Myxococcales bacterium]|nr:hypothetical protein [Myxococcales bacterium]MCB9520737.1 hypothetical protein [Myxococcales bacterium]